MPHLTETTGQRSVRRSVGLTPAGAVRLFEVDPLLARDLPADIAARLTRHALAEVRSLERGSWDPRAEDFGARRLFGLLVLDGVLVRHVTVGPRNCAELLGEGDLVRPDQADADDYAAVAQCATWTVVAPARLAVLDQDLIAGLAPLDGVLPTLAARLIDRSRALALRLAVAQFPNLAERVQVLLWHLADRWGRREACGVVIDLRLSQDLLAELLGAHRSSVNSALRELSAKRIVEARNGTWILHGELPDELLGGSEVTDCDPI